MFPSACQLKQRSWPGADQWAFFDLDKKLTDNLYAHGNDLIDPAARASS
jgi:hypothetical protein